MARFSFLLYTLGRYAAGQNADCPHCGSSDTVRIGRKKLLLELRRCAACRLMFRYPKDDAGRNDRYYQDGYHDPSVTTLPDAATLAGLLETGFADGNLNVSSHIDHIVAAGGSGRLLDLGCSWGYGVWQFRRSGFDAVGFEISHGRARFGRERLGVDILDSPDALSALPDARFDVVHASHVLEHLPEIAATLRFVRRVLRPGGLFVAYMPNCGGAHARRFGPRWSQMISEEHVLALDAEFFAGNMLEYGFAWTAFNSSPYCGLPADCEAARLAGRLDGEELLVLAR